MKKFYIKFIVPVLVVLVWLIVMILPYGISKFIVAYVDKKVGA